MNKWKASAIHFSISFAIFIALVAIILLVWYPGLLFESNGGWEGLRIVIAVDLILGPLLTLIVFKEGKASLKFDLISIAVFQSVCLMAGMWLVYKERPVVLVLEHNTVFSLSEREFIGLGNSMSDLNEFSGSYPKFVRIDLPADDVVAEQLAASRQLNGNPFYASAEYYNSLSSSAYEFDVLVRQRDRFILDIGGTNQVPEDCLLSKFASSSTTGHICLDSSGPSITEFFDP